MDNASQQMLSPSKMEWKAFQEIKKDLIEANPQHAPFLKLVSLYTYTCAHRGVRVGMDTYISELQSRNAEISGHDIALLHNARDVLDSYARIVLELSEPVRSHWSEWLRSEDAIQKREIDTAFENYLNQVPSFTYKELLAHMEKYYSEKKLLKYVGPIPLYKDVLMFTEDMIQKKLQYYIEKNMVLSASSDSPIKKQKSKGSKHEEDEVTEPELLSAKFVSLPYAFSMFFWQWDPTLIQPSNEHNLKEMERAMQEIIGCQISNLQASKVLKLFFKDCETDFSRIIPNYAKVLALYYKQLNEPAPQFISMVNGVPIISLGVNPEEPEKVSQPAQAVPQQPESEEY